MNKDRCTCGNEAVIIRETLNDDGSVSCITVCEECSSLESLRSTLLDEDFHSRMKVAMQNICMCGMNKREFETKRQLGCFKCTEKFAEAIEEIAEALYGGASYLGPETLDINTYKRQVLLKRIDDAVEKEDYELAARLRKELRSLEEGE